MQEKVKNQENQVAPNNTDSPEHESTKTPTERPDTPVTKSPVLSDKVQNPEQPLIQVPVNLGFGSGPTENFDSQKQPKLDGGDASQKFVGAPMGASGSFQTSASFSSTPTFIDHAQSFGNPLTSTQLNQDDSEEKKASQEDPFFIANEGLPETQLTLDNQLTGNFATGLGTGRPSTGQQPVLNIQASPQINIGPLNGLSLQPPRTINVTAPTLNPPQVSAFTPPVISIQPPASLEQPTIAINVAPQLALGNPLSLGTPISVPQLTLGNPLSLGTPTQSNSSMSNAVMQLGSSPQVKSMETYQNASSQNKLPSLSLQQPPISIQVNTAVSSSVQSLTMINTMPADKEVALDLRDLDSSDEDLSAGPSGGCTGEPQQFKVTINDSDEKRLLGTGLPPSLGTQASQNSGLTSSSETNDQVHPLSTKLKKTQSQAPIFDKSNLDGQFNEGLPQQFQINSYSQAQRKIEEVYQDLQKVVKIARQYRQDFQTLQTFIKNHFKSADLLFKNSGLMAAAQGDEDRTVSILQSCFQETPTVAMAFASPLCRRVIDPVTLEERVDTVPLLDFSKEFKGAVEGIEETGNQINVDIVPATLEKFTNCLMQKPIGLHFTGHGVENNAATIGQDTYLMSNQGNCLVFEKEDASAHFVSEKKLTDLFEMHVTSLKFVFIATCHSEFAGEIFHNAGVDHVICVKQGATIMDKAAIFFARKFYQTLFMEKYTICDSFKMAKNCLKMHHEYIIQKEADKLIMILNTDKVKSSRQQAPKPTWNAFALDSSAPVESLKKPEKPKKLEHNCCVLGPFKKREDSLIEAKPMYPFEVAKITEFVGRQKEMQEIIAAVLQNRLTTVLGVPGIGKTTIAKSVGFHLAERKTFHDGIMFFTMRGKDQTTALIQMLYLFLQKYDPNSPSKLTGNGGDSSQQPQSMMEKNRLLKQQSAIANDSTKQIVPVFGGAAVNRAPAMKPGVAVGGVGVPAQEIKQDYVYMQQEVYQYLEAKQVLIIIDNVEDVLREDEEELRNFLGDLYEKLPGVSILTTSRQKIQNLGDVTECLYQLKQLTNRFSIQLLEKKALRNIDEEEIKELFETPVPMRQAYKTPFVEGDPSKDNERKTNRQQQQLKVEDHHLCILLGGHPHAISLVAPFLQGGRRLADLYKMLLNMIESEDFMKDMGQLDPTQSLKVSMDTSTMHMRNTQPEALHLFCMLGMLPGGVSDKDLPHLWHDNKWLLLTETLRRASLIVERSEDKGVRFFRLLPFMNKYAESLLSPFDRIKYHNQCCNWLLKKVMVIFKTIKTEETRGNDNFKEEMLQIETNIWACIYRICDFSRNRKETQKLKEQQENSNHQQVLTGYSSAADEYEAVILKVNHSIMGYESSNVSGDEFASSTVISSSNKAAPPPAYAATSSQDGGNGASQSTMSGNPAAQNNQSQLSNIAPNPAQQLFNFNSSSLRNNNNNSNMNRSSFNNSGGSALSKPTSRKMSLEEAESSTSQSKAKASDSSLNDRASGSLTGDKVSASFVGLVAQEPFLDSSIQQISERPILEDAPSDYSDEEDNIEEPDNKRRVSFAVTTNIHDSMVKKSKLGAFSNNQSLGGSFRDRHNTSPFNATLSQIDAEESYENSDSNTLNVKNFGRNSIKVSRLSFMDTIGEGQNSGRMSALSSLNQSSANIERDNTNNVTFDQQPQKKLVKSNTQKYLDYSLPQVFDQQKGDDLLKRQSSITDTHLNRDDYDELVRLKSKDDSYHYKSERIKKPAGNEMQPKLEAQDVQKLNEDSSHETANAFDISFNKKSEDFKQVKRSFQEDSTEQSKTISSGNKDNQEIASQPRTLINTTATQDQQQQPQNGPPGQTTESKDDNQGNSLRYLTTHNMRIPRERHLIKPIFRQKNNKLNQGSMALKSTLETIQEKYELSNDSLLIVAYISVLVLNFKYTDAVRAIEIVFTAEPNDVLLMANLRKLNAFAILKQETNKFQLSTSINQAFKQFQEAMTLFEKFARKINCDNDANLGKAACLFGMAHIKLRHWHNFITQHSDEDQALRHAAQLFEQAIEIYKKRNHFEGAAHCIQNLIQVRKKLQSNTGHLQNECKKLRTQKRPQTIEAGDRVPKNLIYRHDGWDVSLLIEIIDRYHVQPYVDPHANLKSSRENAKSNLLSLPSSSSNELYSNRNRDRKTKSRLSPQHQSSLTQQQPSKPNLSKKLEDSQQTVTQDQTEEKRFGRQSNKVFASQTRQNNKTALAPKPSIDVRVNNFLLSENSAAENDNEKVVEVKVTEGLSEIVETDYYQLQAKRKQQAMANADIEKFKQKYEQKRRQHQKEHSPKPKQKKRPKKKISQTDISKVEEDDSQQQHQLDTTTQSSLTSSRTQTQSLMNASAKLPPVLPQLGGVPAAPGAPQMAGGPLVPPQSLAAFSEPIAMQALPLSAMKASTAIQQLQLSQQLQHFQPPQQQQQQMQMPQMNFYPPMQQMPQLQQHENMALGISNQFDAYSNIQTHSNYGSDNQEMFQLASELSNLQMMSSQQMAAPFADEAASLDSSLTSEMLLKATSFVSNGEEGGLRARRPTMPTKERRKSSIASVREESKLNDASSSRDDTKSVTTQQSHISNRQSLVQSQQTQSQSQLSLPKRINKRFANVTSKVATYIQGKTSSRVNQTASKQDTPQTEKELSQAANSVKKERLQVDQNPFNTADDVEEESKDAPSMSSRFSKNRPSATSNSSSFVQQPQRPSIKKKK